MKTAVSAHDIRIVWLKELRETLRDRRTLAVMLLFPLVVYPLMSLLMTEVVAGKQAAEATRASRVAITGGDLAARQGLRAALAAVRGRANGETADAVADGGTKSSDAAGDGAPRANVGAGHSAGAPKVSDIALFDVVPEPGAASSATHAPAAGDVAAGAIDALIDLGQAGRTAGTRSIRVVYDETRPASDQAHERLALALGRALPAGCAPAYAVTATSLASKAKVGGYVLSKVLPLIVVIMTMLGAFYPAIDITAGERERGTLETLLSSPVRRFDLMTGKVLAVATLAMLTGALNIVSLSLTVAETARLAGGAGAFAIPWTRAFATLLVVVPAAFLFASVMVAVGALARGFKEAQTLLMPIYLLCLTPSLATTVGDFPLAGVTLLVPGTNLTLLARDLMLGTARVLPAAIVLLSTLAFSAAALTFAARLYDSERLLTSTDAGQLSLGAWLRLLLARPGAPGAGPHRAVTATPTTPGHALALFGVAFVMWFFVFTWLQHWRLLPGLLLSQWGGFLGLVWLYARLTRRSLAEVLVLRRPRAAAVAGAVCIGLSCWLILGILADRVMPPPREVVESIRRLIRPPGEERPLWLSVFALAVTPAVCEEALFRGPILRGLRRQLPTALACTLTGVLFGILHGDVWRFVPTALLGGLLSWVALTSGSLIPSVVIHVVNNTTLIVLGYFGLDEAAEHLSSRTNLLLAGGAVVLLLVGIGAVSVGRRQASENPQDFIRPPV